MCSTTGMSGNSLTHAAGPDAMTLYNIFLEGKRVGMASAIKETLSAANKFPTSPPLSLATIPATSTITLVTSNTSSTTTPSPPSISTPPAVMAISQPITASCDVSQNTAISDRPKAKPVSKKEGKNIRKAASSMADGKMQQQQATLIAGLQQQYQQQQHHHTYQVQQVHQLQQLNQQLQLQLDQVQVCMFSLFSVNMPERQIISKAEVILILTMCNTKA